MFLRIEAPLTAFRPKLARDYQETWPAPPPSTVFGLLMSLCGIWPQQTSQFKGARLAIAISPGAQRSTVLRKMHRGEEGKTLVPKWRPEYQELLVDLTTWVFIPEEQAQERALVGFVRAALEHPEQVERSGGLSFGESAFLVHSIKELPAQALEGEPLQVLMPTNTGFLQLPVWVDFSDDKLSRHQRFELSEYGQLGDDALISLG